MRQIAITGLGVVSAYGNSLELFMRGLNEQKSLYDVIKSFTLKGVTEARGGETTFESSSPEERVISMGVKALNDALMDWGGRVEACRKVALVVGSGLGLDDQHYAAETTIDDKNYLFQLGEMLKEGSHLAEVECEVLYIGSACAAASQSISHAMELLNFADFDLVIAGGVDNISPMAYGGFQRLHALDPEGCRPFDRERKGIMVGEGAVFYLLERAEESRAEREPYALLAGAGVTGDAFNVVQVEPSGREIKRAFDQALTAAGLDRSEVELIVAHGTGTALNDRIEAKLLEEYFADSLERVAVTAPKGAIGHTGGASGAFGLLTAIGAIQGELIPPVMNLRNIDAQCKLPLVMGKPLRRRVDVALINAFAFGGTNVVLLCKRAEALDIEEHSG